MITVKAFDKGLKCRDFKYEVGNTYSIPTEKVEMCVYGFHASSHCDISETTIYYPFVTENEYALVDIHVIDRIDDKVVGDRITILRKLETLDELIKYDKTGEWCYEYAKRCNDTDIIKQLQDAVIEKDETGEYCCYFAENVEDADIPTLEKAVIEKDRTGRWCYYLARWVNNTNTEKLQGAVIQKDKTGMFCFYFSRYVKGANIKKLQEAIIQKDQSGQWCLEFAYYIPGADTKKLESAAIEKSKRSI